MNIAVAKRVLQFCAGPERHMFYACQECKAALEKGDISCFLPIKDKPVEPVDPADGISCDLCEP